MSAGQGRSGGGGGGSTDVSETERMGELRRPKTGVAVGPEETVEEAKKAEMTEVESEERI